MARDASLLDKETSVSFRDNSFDAKTFTYLHPLSSGSFNSIADSASYSSFVKNRMHSIDPCFRDDSLWIFAQEDRKVKLQLHAQASQQTEGTADPKQVFATTQKMSRHSKKAHRKS